MGVQREFSPDLANLTYERLCEVRRALVDEHCASYRWLLASLLLINSGGLFGLSDVSVGRPNFLLAGIAFWVGIALALISAWIGQVQTRKFIKANAELEEFWAVAAITGEVDVEKGSALEENLDEIKSTLARWTGVGSFVLFSTGIFAIGAGHDLP